MERAEAEAIYDAGRERCVEVILELAASVERLTLLGARLEERVRCLEEQSRQSSRNSSKPPSLDPPKTRAERRAEARAKAKAWAKRDGERKPGAQVGHRGSGRELLPEDQVDEFVDHYPDACDGCGHEFKIDFSYKHSRVKQYLKDGRALRIEAVINKPSDLDVLARLEHLPELIEKARQVTQRLLIIERAGQDCAIGTALFERIHQPYTREGQRTGAFRFGDQRATALAGALCTTLNAVTGFSNKSLRGHVAGHLGREYSQHQMSYDFRRLRLHGLIQRIPHRNTYTLTPDGIRVAVFYTKLQNRLLQPLLEADNPPAPPDVRRALATLEHAVTDHVTAARLKPATA